MRFEPLLVLPAGLPLVLPELVPPWAPVLALAWLAVLWLARWWATGRPTVRTAIDWPVAALLASVPAAVWAVRPDVAGPEVPLSRVYALLFGVALAYALANAVATPRRAWLAAGALLAGAILLALLALVSVNWESEAPALAFALRSLPQAVTTIPHATLRGAGVHPNTLASLALLAVPLSVSVIRWRSHEGGGSPRSASTLPAPPRPVVWLAWGAAIASVAVLALAQSRGAWLALAAALVGLWAVRHPVSRGTAAAAAAVLVLLVSMVLLWAEPLQAFGGRDGVAEGDAARPQTAASRLALWRGSMELLARRPDAGIGLNTFPLVYGQRPEYQGRYVYQGYAHAHNTLLQAALDYGVPGFAAVVALYASVGWAAHRAHRRLRGTAMDAVVVGLALGLGAHALHGLVDAVAIGAKPGFVPWAYVGALVGTRRFARRWVEAVGR